MATPLRIKIALLGALVAGGALTAAGQAGAQPVPPIDPALPPGPPAAAPAPAPFVYTPIAEGAIPAPAPPPVGAPFIPPVPNADFNNTGQFDFLRNLWNMRDSAAFFQSVTPGAMDPSEFVPPAPYGSPPPMPIGSPPPPPGAPPAPASAPPPIWPPSGMVPTP
jgi:hypothetical protein